MWHPAGMAPRDLKMILNQYLQHGRDALLWKMEGLGDYDIRRPLTPTGTNLLGIVKHVASVEAGYFGATFERPFDHPLPWFHPDAEPNADMWATAEESRDEIVDLYRKVWAHSDETIASLSLDAPGKVPWWPEERRQVTLGQILAHMVAETHRHAGHSDIVRELIDETVGYRPEADNMPDVDEAWWKDHRRRLEEVARRFR